MTEDAAPFTYPAFYAAAGQASKLGQDRYMLAIATRLSALAIAALGGAVSVYVAPSFDPFAWVAFVGFVCALGAETYILSASPDRLWYEGRAAAESAKTLTWRYAVRGDPFANNSDPGSARIAFVKQLQAIVDDLRHPSLPPSPGKEQVPDDLQATRDGDFASRKQLYAIGRIDDQIDWYSGKSKSNSRRMQQFLLITISLELFGAVAATLRISAVIDFDLLGIFAAVTAGAASWAQTRQYGSLSSAYAIASHELATIKAELPGISERDWPRFVDEAEEAISREHTLWTASRGVLPKKRTL